MSAISQEQLHVVVDQLRATGFAKYGPWTFAFTLKGSPTTAGGFPIPVNLFTAKVHASTVETDWADMGAICKALGVPGPDQCEWPKTIETDADATHRWFW